MVNLFGRILLSIDEVSDECYNLTQLAFFLESVFMITEEKRRLAKDFIMSRPTKFPPEMNATSAGIGLVMKLLFSSPSGKLTAGEISEAMCVSTARVAVLLKKMEKKGLIVKSVDESDARVTNVRLSDVGYETVKAMREDMIERASMLIDKLGEEKIRLFIDLSLEVRDAMEEVLSSNPIIKR